MKKHLRFIPAAAAVLAALGALVFFGQKQRPPVAPVAPVAQTPAFPPMESKPPQIDALVATLVRRPQIADASALPLRMGTQTNGALRFLGIERGWRLPAGASLVVGDPAATARGFLLANRTAFGLANPRMELTFFRAIPNPGFTAVRLQQTYGNLPVLAAETVVQVSAAGDIQFVLADLATHLPNLDRLPLPLVPAISAAQAPVRAVALVRGEMKRGPVRAAAPQLVVYVPDVLGLPGEPALAWEVPVESPGEPVSVRGRVIVHADSGALLNFLDEIHSATDRRIYDDGNNAVTEPTIGGPGDNPVRVEGGPTTGIAEVDNLYSYIGQTDAFYLANNGRNGYDGAGGRIFAVARSVPPGQTAPWGNAKAGGNVMQFGVGFVSDDIVAHEYTHLVTGQTSRLIYQNASGAINESLSDIWGELMDMSNGGQIPNGNDASNVRWEVGEDRPAGPLRSMSDPGRDLALPPGPARLFTSPDRLSSGAYVPVAVNPGAAPDGDSGGVHTNSGVSNKLCFLLTDGGAFNGQTITPEGPGNVATLFYQVQVNFLVPAADWRDLYFAITAAAANLEWSAPRQLNVNRACTAVEISTSAHDYFIDSSSPVQTSEVPPRPIIEVGIPNVVGNLGPFRSVPAGVNAVNDGGNLRINGIVASIYHVSPGTTYTITKPMTINAYNSAANLEP